MVCRLCKAISSFSLLVEGCCRACREVPMSDLGLGDLCIKCQKCL